MLNSWTLTLVGIWDNPAKWIRQSVRPWRCQLIVQLNPDDTLEKKFKTVHEQLTNSGFFVDPDEWDQVPWDAEHFTEVADYFNHPNTFHDPGVTWGWDTDDFNEGLSQLYDFGDEERVIIKIEGLTDE